MKTLKTIAEALRRNGRARRLNGHAINQARRSFGWFSSLEEARSGRGQGLCPGKQPAPFPLSGTGLYRGIVAARPGSPRALVLDQVEAKTPNSRERMKPAVCRRERTLSQPSPGMSA